MVMASTEAGEMEKYINFFGSQVCTLLRLETLDQNTHKSSQKKGVQTLDL